MTEINNYIYNSTLADLMLYKFLDHEINPEEGLRGVYALSSFSSFFETLTALVRTLLLALCVVFTCFTIASLRSHTKQSFTHSITAISGLFLSLTGIFCPTTAKTSIIALLRWSGMETFKKSLLRSFRESDFPVEVDPFKEIIEATLEKELPSCALLEKIIEEIAAQEEIKTTPLSSPRAITPEIDDSSDKLRTLLALRMQQIGRLAAALEEQQNTTTDLYRELDRLEEDYADLETDFNERGLESLNIARESQIFIDHLREALSQAEHSEIELLKEVDNAAIKSREATIAIEDISRELEEKDALIDALQNELFLKNQEVKQLQNDIGAFIVEGSTKLKEQVSLLRKTKTQELRELTIRASALEAQQTSLQETNNQEVSELLERLSALEAALHIISVSPSVAEPKDT